jgi:type IV pilus assembly protein PilQ
MTSRLLSSLALALLLTPDSWLLAPAAAQSKTPPAAAPAPAASAGPEIKIKEIESAQPSIKTGKDAAGNETLSVDFPDEDIRTILRNVADLFELNLVIPDTLQGKTSVKLRDVSWRQIFKVCLGPVNYTFIEDGSIIKIVSNESLQQEPTVTEVFILNYARASDIMATVSSLVDTATGGKIVVDARSNALVISERPSKFNRIRPIIDSLDKATDQVTIETKFIEVQDSDIRDVGVKWDSLRSFQVGASPAKEGLGTVSRTRGQTFETGGDNRNTNTAGNSNTAATSDTTAQNSGSTTSGSVTSTNGVLTNTSTTGTTGALTAGVTTDAKGNITTSVDSTLTQLQSLAHTGGTQQALSAVFNASQFNLVLSALSTLGGTRIVSNPTITTLNNTEALINVGEERPIPRYTYNEQRGTFEVNGFDYKPIGVILKVTPQINSRGFIKLTVEPEVSQTNGSSSFNGAEIPIIASRKAKTQVSLKDGQTMGIGGLLSKNAADSTTKVPVLGSIPVLGKLFTHKSHDIQTRNLLIFITAKIVSAEGAPPEVVFDPRQIQNMQLRRSDLPGFRLKGEDPFLPELPKPEEKVKGRGREKKAAPAPASEVQPAPAPEAQPAPAPEPRRAVATPVAQPVAPAPVAQPEPAPVVPAPAPQPAAPSPAPTPVAPPTPATPQEAVEAPAPAATPAPAPTPVS